MERVLRKDGYTVFKKRNGRFAVRKNDKKRFVHGEEKLNFLRKVNMLKVEAKKEKKEKKEKKAKSPLIEGSITP